ncbi:hypothetical protein X975_20536, partial [Stegodyphus mimosarum]
MVFLTCYMNTSQFPLQSLAQCIPLFSQTTLVRFAIFK